MKEQLQNLRKMKHLTQADLAEILEVSLSLYQKYERDAVSPSYDKLIKIADFYGVTTDYLLGRETGEADTIDKLVGEFNMTALEKKILEGYLELPDNLRGDFMEFLQKSVREVQNEEY